MQNQFIPILQGYLFKYYSIFRKLFFDNLFETATFGPI
jgi:hypothetical protein